MKRFFVLLFLLVMGLPSFSYHNDFLAEIDGLIYFSNNNWAEFKNPNVKQVTYTSYGNQGERIDVTFYKIDDTFLVTPRGVIYNYKTNKYQNTEIKN